MWLIGIILRLIRKWGTKSIISIRIYDTLTLNYILIVIKITSWSINHGMNKIETIDRYKHGLDEPYKNTHKIMLTYNQVANERRFDNHHYRIVIDQQR